MSAVVLKMPTRTQRRLTMLADEVETFIAQYKEDLGQLADLAVAQVYPRFEGQHVGFDEEVRLVAFEAAKLLRKVADDLEGMVERRNSA